MTAVIDALPIILSAVAVVTGVLCVTWAALAAWHGALCWRERAARRHREPQGCPCAACEQAFEDAARDALAVTRPLPVPGLPDDGAALSTQEERALDLLEAAAAAEEAAGIAALAGAGRRAMAAVTHPEHEMVPCPRCSAPGREMCVTAGGTLLEWGHLERHQAAIAADGRTCAGREGSS